MANEEPKKKSVVLDLISGSSKKHSTAGKAADAAPAAPVSPVSPVSPAAEQPKRPAAPKKEVLDLLSPRKVVKKQAAPASASAEAAPAAQPAPAAAPAQPEMPKMEAPAPVTPDGKILNIKAPISVADLAALMSLKPFKLIAELLPMGVFANPATVLDSDQVAALCEKHGFTFERVKREKGAGVKAPVEEIKEPEAVAPEEEPEDALKVRTPIITVMGHVDHGKTSLLDYIRRTKVVAGEAGGITQHIGAYTVEHDGKTITFIDTPGHAIFTEMRARGADVTDIVVLVVAANDGIMPQTREAIMHAKAAHKTIIVAINKCDLPAADPMRVRTQLMEEGLMPTDFGGDIECVNVSAATGEGIDELLDLLCLQAEVLELKANPRANCRASIIEARMEQGKGSSATVIVQSGTLKVGMPFICGPYSGKVKTLFNDKGKAIKKVTPGMPAEVSGFLETPNVGDELVEMESERAARKLSTERQEELRQQRLSAPKRSRMEDILAMMGEGNQKAVLKLYLKGDVQGSVEAIKKAIMDIKSDKVECEFIGAAAGPISESDVLLASSSDAVILGFNVKVESNAVKAVKREGVQVKIFSIVYELIDQVKDAMLGLLEPETRETVLGHAQIKQVFKLNKGKAAGSYVSDGKMQRTAEARVIRDGQVVFDGKMSTLRRFQDEVEEVKSGLECGIRLADYNDYEEGDIIECYLLEKIKQTL
ncbi:MAG TPA: translation initiation factor IF-2 [Candidatus Akkermansia intestinavium]|nr:translation initiation factor IF-2 [Candidatus Akkermansia intestinavium]